MNVNRGSNVRKGPNGTFFSGGQKLLVEVFEDIYIITPKGNTVTIYRNREAARQKKTASQIC